MELLEISIPVDASYRASEIVADLRNAAEELFGPMKVVGYWDAPTTDHLCPLAILQLDCPNVDASKTVQDSRKPPCSIELNAYRESVEYERSGVLELYFPHANVHIFLS